MTLSRRILERLLAGGERAQARGRKGARAERFCDPGHEYWSLPLLERDALHVRLREAEAAGAVALSWARFGGDDRPIDSVRLVEVEKLATFLGRTVRSKVLVAAARSFAPMKEDVPTLDRVLEAWQAMRSVKGFGPESADVFVDAARVITHMRGAVDDGIVRQVSRALFRDSKRLERLVPCIGYLLSPEQAQPLHQEEVLAEIGLRKEPAPFLLAGAGEVALQGNQRLPLVSPFVGVSAPHVSGFFGAADWVLSIENLTTFHLAAARHPSLTGGLLLYTAGMPSPTWRRAYRRIVDSLPEAKLYHWGDVDPGGFRIAACVAQALEGRLLRPWLMNPPSDGDPSDETSRRAMVDAAKRAGWNELAEQFAAQLPVKLEQEAREIVLPTAKR